MPPDNRAPSSREDPSSTDADLLRSQREANERLVLATIEAHENVDRARGAQRSAEYAVGALRENAEEERSIAEFRELLIGIVGHDLRNPLNTILIASDLVLGDPDLGDANARLVNRIVSSGKRMARMIAQLREFTRARLGGGITLALAETDLGEICRNIAEELRISSSAEVQLAVTGDLGGTWDADGLAAVISNIAGNAIDHCLPGTPVMIDAHAEADLVVVSITNRGPCIPPELVPFIFQAFRRQGEAVKRKEHLGLGLYISWEIVRAHGGILEVTSADDVTTFTVRLPRVSSRKP
ncbi:MAG: phosphoserine phosphatase RsbU/P [Myxococcales bacterium]|nr:phosphoserine phosphatase RsbU/P [Myxococcales bacterium]